MGKNKSYLDTPEKRALLLLESKLSLDRLTYIAHNLCILSGLPLVELIDDALRCFYLKCALVLDSSCVDKKVLCSGSDKIKKVYWYRDRNYAHMDDVFTKGIDNHTFITTVVLNATAQLDEIYATMRDELPKYFTLDYLEYDLLLSRYLQGRQYKPNRYLAKLETKFPEGFMTDCGVDSPRHRLSFIDFTLRLPSYKESVCLYDLVQRLQRLFAHWNCLCGMDFWCSLDDVAHKYVLRRFGIDKVKSGWEWLEALDKAEAEQLVSDLIRVYVDYGEGDVYAEG